ncbi:MAG: HDIG domain-containing protein, partial [Gemmatimonadota bacterium]
KQEDELERERAALQATLAPTYDLREWMLDTVLVRIDSIFDAIDSVATGEELRETAAGFGVPLTPEQAEYLTGDGMRDMYRRALRTMMRQQLPRGIPTARFDDTEQSSTIQVSRDGIKSPMSKDSVHTFERFMDSRIAVHPDYSSTVGDLAFVQLINYAFMPTLVFNRDETDREERELLDSVNPVKDTVRQDERIVMANERVSATAYERLVALRGELERPGQAQGDITVAIGQILANALLLVLFWVLLMLYLPAVYASLRKMTALTLMFALVIGGAAGNVWLWPGAPPELIPIPFAAMLVTVIINGRLAMVSAMVLAVLLGSQGAFGGADAIFVALVGGVVAGLSLRSIRRRNQLLISVLVVTGAFLLVGVTQALRLEGGIADVGRTVALGGLNAMVSAALVTIMLPLFELLTRVTTEVTLLELSDPNRPLLRRLAIETPGTYAHSLALANLCEAACNAIGANGLLARVGCYYHDIGKLKKSQYFVENQMPGVNPHDKLKPEVSASIIRNHVREGLALANENRLPESIKAFIPAHHGTMEISYFLDRARNRDDEAEINVDEFRYPGPKPTTVETAVVMLGDSVEAAVRVLEDASEQKMRDAIDHLFRQRVEAGQLDEAPLTMAQLTVIRDEFVRVFEGVRHSRIDYPTTSGGLSSDWDAADDA